MSGQISNFNNGIDDQSLRSNTVSSLSIRNKSNDNWNHASGSKNGQSKNLAYEQL